MQQRSRRPARQSAWCRYLKAGGRSRRLRTHRRLPACGATSPAGTQSSSLGERPCEQTSSHQREDQMRPKTTMIAALVAAGLSGAVIAEPAAKRDAPAPAAKKDAPAPAAKKSAAAPRATTGVAPAQQGFDAEINRHAQAMLAEGRETFRYDTFGSEAFWGDALQLHKAIAGEKNGGVGPGVSPKTALSVGLKVDADALPDALKRQLAAGKVNLDDPATTLALLKLNAVVGVTAFANADGSVKSMGIQCAFCHSTVDNSFAPGI